MTSSLTHVIAERVRVELNTSARTQQELATYLGISQPGISRRLAGLYAFSVHELPKVAEFFGLSVNELLERKQQAS